MLSWIVFFMEKDDIGNRMALGITTILTIMFLLGSLNGNLPKVSYPKALDWYLLVGFSFVFLSLIECMIVYVLTVKATEKGTDVKFEVNAILNISEHSRQTRAFKEKIRLEGPCNALCSFEGRLALTQD